LKFAKSKAGRLIAILAVGILALIIPTGCAKAATAAVGDTVTIDFSLWLQDGSLYYTTAESGPLEYVLGSSDMIQGAQEAIVGMKVGESKVATIPPEKAFGEVQPDLIQVVSRDLMPEGFEPAVGKSLNTQVNGQTTSVIITEVTDSTVTVDANDPLAGQTIKMEVKLLTVTSPNEVSGNIAGQPPLVWILSAGLVVLLAAFILFFLITQRRLKQLEYATKGRRRRVQ
jgi:peptidylprolyl isomerase